MRAFRPQSAPVLAASAALLLHGGLVLAWLPEHAAQPPAVAMQVISVALMEKKAAPEPALEANEPARPEPPPRPVERPVEKRVPQPAVEPPPVAEHPTPIPQPAEPPVPPTTQEMPPAPSAVEREESPLAPEQITPAEVADAGPDDATQEAQEKAVAPPLFDAAYLRNPPPAYPRSARRLRQEGVVELRVRVSAEGVPAELLVARSSGVAVLDRAALSAVRRWRFVPAQRGGAAVEAWVVIPIEFRLEG